MKFIVNLFFLVFTVIKIFSLDNNHSHNVTVALLPLSLFTDNMLSVELKDSFQNILHNQFLKPNIDPVFVNIKLSSNDFTYNFIKNNTDSHIERIKNESNPRYIVHFELRKYFSADDFSTSQELQKMITISINVIIFDTKSNTMVFNEVIEKVYRGSDYDNVVILNKVYQNISQYIFELIDQTGFLKRRYFHSLNNNIIVKFDDDLIKRPLLNQHLIIVDGNSNKTIGGAKIFFQNQRVSYGMITYTNTLIIDNKNLSYIPFTKYNMDIDNLGGLVINFDKLGNSFYPFIDLRIFTPTGTFFFKPSLGINFLFFYTESKLMTPITVYTGLKLELNLNRFIISLGFNLGCYFSQDKQLKYIVDSIYINPHISFGITLNNYSSIKIEIGYSYYNNNELLKNWKKDLSGFTVKAGPSIQL